MVNPNILYFLYFMYIITSNQESNQTDLTELHFDTKPGYSSTGRSPLRRLWLNSLVHPLRRLTELFAAPVTTQDRSFHLPNQRPALQALFGHLLELSISEWYHLALQSASSIGQQAEDPLLEHPPLARLLVAPAALDSPFSDFPAPRPLLWPFRFLSGSCRVGPQV